mmetsp:Transcript_40047/g.61242  ORF Transcript_40047/g.61242 Transcript_40047/m.61242 type:complete len:138 (+) Transcript_40047:178-591(+)
MMKKDLKVKVPVERHPLKGINAYMFGDNREGKCGIGSEETFITRPSYLFAKFKRIVSGFHHSMAIDHHRVLYSWGRNKFGQLGHGFEEEEQESVGVPTLVKGLLERVVIKKMACGYQHSMALTPNGFLFSWGLNVFG